MNFFDTTQLSLSNSRNADSFRDNRHVEAENYSLKTP